MASRQDARKARKQFRAWLPHTNLSTYEILTTVRGRKRRSPVAGLLPSLRVLAGRTRRGRVPKLALKWIIPVRKHRVARGAPLPPARAKARRTYRVLRYAPIANPVIRRHKFVRGKWPPTLPGKIRRARVPRLATTNLIVTPNLEGVNRRTWPRWAHYPIPQKGRWRRTKLPRTGWQPETLVAIRRKLHRVLPPISLLAPARPRRTRLLRTGRQAEVLITIRRKRRPAAVALPPARGRTRRPRAWLPQGKQANQIRGLKHRGPRPKNSSPFTGKVHRAKRPGPYTPAQGSFRHRGSLSRCVVRLALPPASGRIRRERFRLLVTPPFIASSRLKHRLVKPRNVPPFAGKRRRGRVPQITIWVIAKRRKARSVLPPPAAGKRRRGRLPRLGLVSRPVIVRRKPRKTALTLPPVGKTRRRRFFPTGLIAAPIIRQHRTARFKWFTVFIGDSRRKRIFGRGTPGTPGGILTGIWRPLDPGVTALPPDPGTTWTPKDPGVLWTSLEKQLKATPDIS